MVHPPAAPFDNFEQEAKHEHDRQTVAKTLDAKRRKDTGREYRQGVTPLDPKNRRQSAATRPPVADEEESEDQKQRCQQNRNVSRPRLAKCPERQNIGISQITSSEKMTSALPENRSVVNCSVLSIRDVP